MSQRAIPRNDVGALYSEDQPERSYVDAAVHTAAKNAGMMVVTRLPPWASLDGPSRRELLGIFSLPESEIRKLWRWNFAPENRNVYRGWFPLQAGHATYKEGIDLGPDVAHGPGVVDDRDPLREATPMPSEALLPGWHSRVRDYYRAMTRLSVAMMHSIARALNLPENCFDGAFDGGISTLRLIRYPVRLKASFEGGDHSEMWTTHRGEPRYLLGRAHVDSGFMTLLAQDGVGGLQAQHLDGRWLDVPPEEGTLAINFGKVLERWTAGGIRATVHRVLGSGSERYSIPFFYEARADAVIAPLPIPGAESFEPFYYGDHLWDVTTKFVEQRGIAHLRKPLGMPRPNHTGPVRGRRYPQDSP
jgi:isopenicillin N synthase-like dioxygenase